MSLMHRSFFINSSELVSYFRNRSRRKMPQPSLPMDVFFNSAFPSMSYEWVTPKHRVTVHFFVFVFVSFLFFIFVIHESLFMFKKQTPGQDHVTLWLPFDSVACSANVCQTQIASYSYHYEHDCSFKEFLLGILINFVRLITCN